MVERRIGKLGKSSLIGTQFFTINMGEKTISDIRQEFDDIDKSILVLLDMRQKLSKEIAVIKRLHDLPVLQNEIWNTHLKRRIQENQTIKLNDDFLNQIFNLLHKESIRIQNQELEKII